MGEHMDVYGMQCVAGRRELQAAISRFTKFKSSRKQLIASFHRIVLVDCFYHMKLFPLKTVVSQLVVTGPE